MAFQAFAMLSEGLTVPRVANTAFMPGWPGEGQNVGQGLARESWCPSAR